MGIPQNRKCKSPGLGGGSTKNIEWDYMGGRNLQKSIHEHLIMLLSLIRLRSHLNRQANVKGTALSATRPHRVQRDL